VAFLQKVFTSFHNYSDGNTRIGELNRIWYDSNSNTFRIQLDKVTPGGTIIGGGSGGGGLTTATVNTMIANSLTNYATQTWVTNHNYITSSSLTVTTLASGTNALTYDNGVFTFTPSDLSSYATQAWVNNHNYLTAGAGMTALQATPNQTVVQDLGSGVWRVGTVQDIGTTSTVRFGDLTVNNISVLGTSTNLISDIIQGYRLYLASSATNLSQINGGGIQLGNTSTGVHSIFWNSDGYWDTDGDGLTTLTLNAATSTLDTLKVTNQARFGYVNHDLTLANAYIQVDSDANNFSQIAIINHNTGTNASADIVATNDIGDDNNHYIDMGINSSVFSTSSWTVNGANDGYLYINKGSLAIGTDTPGKDIQFFTGGVDSTNIVATVSSSSVNVDAINSLNSSTLALNLDNDGSVSVNTLRIPVGTILGSNTSTIYTLAQLTLTNVVSYSHTSTDTLMVGEYGLLNGVPAPYAVYEFTQTPDPALQVGDLLSGSGIPNILPGTGVGFTGTVVLSVGTGTWSNYVVGYSDYSVLPPPTPGIAVLIGRNTLNANLAITTQPITDIALTPGVGGNIVVEGSIIPLTNDRWDLGSPGKRWRHVWVGAGTIYILDETLGTDTAIGAKDGVVYLQGGVGLNVGEFTFVDNQIKIANPNRDIIVGTAAATGKLVLNRPLQVNTTASNASFTVDRDGKVSILYPSLPTGKSAFSILATAGSNEYTLAAPLGGSLIHGTAKEGSAAFVTVDSFSDTTGGGYFTTRRFRGTVASPAAVQSGDTMAAFATAGYNGTGIRTGVSSARITFKAAENFNATSQSAYTEFRNQVTATGVDAVSAIIDANGLTLPSVAQGGTGTGITFADSTRQITAFTSTNAVTSITAGTGTYVSASTGAVTVWINGAYATTATVNTLIANSLTNFVYTGTVKLSVTTASSGTSALSFTTSTGVFTYTPPNLSAYLTTVTNVAYANTATTVAGGYVSSITAGTGTAVSTSTGAVTVWVVPQAITSTGSTTASNYTIDLSGPTFVHWQPTANGNRTITLTGFTAGRKVEVFITPHQTSDTFTVSGVTPRNCSNNTNIFTNHNIGGSQQDSFMLQIYSTTNDIGGVWIFGSGSV
jgi:hypothetical protein